MTIDYDPVTIQTDFSGELDPPAINGTQVYLPTRITYPTGQNFRLVYTSHGQLTRRVARGLHRFPDVNGKCLTLITRGDEMLVVEDGRSARRPIKRLVAGHHRHKL